MNDDPLVPDPSALNIPGLAFRRFRGSVDYPQMVAVRMGCVAHDRLDPDSVRDPIPTVDDLARTLSDTPAGTPDLLFVEMNGAVIGYSGVSWWNEDDGTWVYLHRGWLLPEWRGRGIEEAMLRWEQARCRELAAEHPTNGKAVYATNICDGEREKLALFERNGYHEVRRVVEMRLTEPVPDDIPALPDGVETRPLTPDHYRAIYALLRDAWAGLWGTTPESEADYQEFLDDFVQTPGYDPALWQVAWSGDEAVGLVVCQFQRGIANVKEVATRRSWRRKGIASSLLLRALHALVGHDTQEVRIFTDAGNGQGARTIYERAGFRALTEHHLLRKPMALVDISAS
jgi:ribosomal protein S18 acetylase RimI-like enzyme